MKPRLMLVTTVLLGCAALAGCGSSEEGAAGDVVAEYLDAVGEREYDDACKLLHESVKSKVGGDCAKELEQRYSSLSGSVRDDFDDIDVRSADVSGDRATVRPADVRVERTTSRRVKGKKKKSTSYSTAQDVTNGAGFTLTKKGGAWLISAGV